MNFEPISPVEWMYPRADVLSGGEKRTEAATPFSDLFHSMIDTVKETDAVKNEKQYLLATGQLDNPAELTIAATQAATSVELLVQMRNKAVEAYNSLMKISL